MRQWDASAWLHVERGFGGVHEPGLCGEMTSAARGWHCGENISSADQSNKIATMRAVPDWIVGKDGEVSVMLRSHDV